MSVVRSALAGLSTGCRTFTGFAALAVATPDDASEQPDATLAKPQVQVPIVVLAATELVMDKLPQTPSRLEPAGLPGRVVFGALCGAVVARRSAAATAPDVMTPSATEAPGSVNGAAVAPGRPSAPPAQVALCAVAGAAGAVAAAYGGSWFRGWFASRTGHDWIGALVEDAVAGGLSYAAIKAPGPV